ncbi:hypothetical protein T492DRAFT_838571 [Pavlovales sp. CCMP2436]|nr:hypothetical protein T492DRAFT_838571 [Pavlovales sp. CCMP2436]
MVLRHYTEVHAASCPALFAASFASRPYSASTRGLTSSLGYGSTANLGSLNGNNNFANASGASRNARPPQISSRSTSRNNSLLPPGGPGGVAQRLSFTSGPNSPDKPVNNFGNNFGENVGDENSFGDANSRADGRASRASPRASLAPSQAAPDSLALPAAAAAGADADLATPHGSPQRSPRPAPLRSPGPDGAEGGDGGAAEPGSVARSSRKARRAPSQPSD